MAASQAIRQAGWSNAVPAPIVLGTTSGGMALGEAFYRQAISAHQSNRLQASRVVHYLCQRQGLDLAEAFGLSGPVTVIANACASGANAIGHAWELLRSGRANRALAGGYDALCQLVFSGFDSLQALSPTTCRPFDRERDGLALGEGAALFTLETFDHARSRGAAILGEIAGYGSAIDRHHLTQPHPHGEAALESMNEACRAAEVGPSQIDYVNAHGTATPLNDAAEAAALRRWAGDHARKLRVSSTKAGIGHTLGAAGAIEAAVCLMAIRGQWLPPQLTPEQSELEAPFSFVRRPEDAPVEYALTNSFGFGGANATLVLRRCA